VFAREVELGLLGDEPLQIFFGLCASATPLQPAGGGEFGAMALIAVAAQGRPQLAIIAIPAFRQSSMMFMVVGRTTLRCRPKLVLILASWIEITFFDMLAPKSCGF
jgi:hypothetical protein